MFFFSSRRRHTRWNCDWSSDVCSSDLRRAGGLPDAGGPSLWALLLGCMLIAGGAAMVNHRRLALDGPLATAWAPARSTWPTEDGPEATRAGLPERSEERRVGKEWRCRG